MKTSLLFVWICCLCTDLKAQKKYIFYHPEIEYGSLGISNPLNIFLTNGFEMLALSDHKQLRRFPLRTKSRNLVESLFNPVEKIENYTWSKFINDEFIPFRPQTSALNFVPNITSHLIAGGYFYSYLSEYYEYHGYEYPKTTAFITSYVKNIINEMIETPIVNVNRVDAIADLYVWDLLGIVLYSTETVKDLFVNHISISNWSTTPILNFDTELVNTNSFIALSPKKFAYRLKPMAMIGLGFLGGLSYKLDSESSISVLGGFQTHSIIFRNRESGILYQAITKRNSAGIFFDKNNSLLASIMVKDDRDKLVRLNIYPGLFSKSIGFFTEIGNTLSVGISVRQLGFGIGN